MKAKIEVQSDNLITHDDFVGVKECYETEYWLEVVQKSEFFIDDILKSLLHDCGAIRRMLISSINTTKSNIEN